MIPTGVATWRQAVVGHREAAQDTRPSLSPERWWKVVAELAGLEKPLASEQAQRDALAATHPACQRLLPMPGLGPCTAPALGAAGSDASAVKNGRQVAAWLGLGPRHPATGGQARLLGMSKRGARDRRTLRLHGARAPRRWGGRQTARRRPWSRPRRERRGTNRPAVAVAPTHVRMGWALLTRHQGYAPAKGSSRRRSG